MADETPPLDEALARMRQLAQNVSARLASGGLENLADWQLRGVTSAYSNDVPVLLAEVGRLRAREAAAMAIVRDVADVEVYYTEQPEEWNCPFCDGYLPGEMTYLAHEATRRFHHHEDCPVTQARTLLAQE